MKSPADCATLEDLRGLIDEVDAALVGLVAKRTACIDRAAEIKAEASIPAYLPDRVDAVLANVRQHAINAGVPPELTDRLWRILIDWAVAHEEETLGASPDRQTKL